MNARFCSSCGRRPLRENCCWFLGPDGDHAHPSPLMPARDWEEWNADQQFLIQLLMEEFTGAAEEWELLCRLPWPGWRLEENVCGFEERPDDAGGKIVCFREPDERDRGRRYFLTDMARHSYRLYQREQQAVAAFRKAFPFGRWPRPQPGAAAPTAVDGEETELPN